MLNKKYFLQKHLVERDGFPYVKATLSTLFSERQAAGQPLSQLAFYSLLRLTGLTMEEKMADQLLVAAHSGKKPVP